MVCVLFRAVARISTWLHFLHQPILAVGKPTPVFIGQHVEESSRKMRKKRKQAFRIYQDKGAGTVRFFYFKVL